jgi:hypothetical protein
MHMQSRTAKFASAIFASLLAGAFLATISHGEARAADDCLSGPKDQTPQGSHWYYRIDHATKRHCWYLRAESEKPSKAIASTSPSSEKPTEPNAETAKLSSIADAHAELPAQTPVEQANRNDTSASVPPADAAGMDNNQASNAGDTNVLSSVVASRWPEASDVTSAVSPPAVNPAAANPSASPQPATDHWAANVPSVPAAEPPPAAADAALATANSAQGSSGSIPMLLVVVAGALALAGITAGVIFKFSDWRRPIQIEVHARRNTIWEPTDDDSFLLPARTGADAMPRRRAFARDLDRTSDGDDRAAEFFSQLSHLSKRTPT